MAAKTKRKPTKPKKDRWYKMTAFFDGPSKSMMKIGGEDVVLCGWIPPDMDCSVVLVPTSVTQEQGLAIQKIVEAQTRKPTLVLTNNTQLVRLKQITEAQAQRIMGGTDGHIVQVEPGAQVEGPGDELREEAGEPDAGDLRPAEPTEGDGRGDPGEGQEPASPAPEDERCQA